MQLRLMNNYEQSEINEINMLIYYLNTIYKFKKGYIQILLFLIIIANKIAIIKLLSIEKLVLLYKTRYSYFYKRTNEMV